MSGPFFDELTVGQRFTGAPPMALTAGAAALHQAILGDRLVLALDPHLAERVTGEPGALAHPGLVWDVAIGQSTVATYRVKANLFYRGLVLRRAPRVGDVLHTVTEVVALRENSRREDRPATGLAALRIVTVDQEDRPVLDFTRCAMLPLSPGAERTGHADDLDAIDSRLEGAGDSVSGWSLDELPKLPAADTHETEGADVVTAAPELARLTLNVAMAHHDRTANANGVRLVYGGHTIGLALAQVTRALPGLATVVAWRSCDHLAPVFEGDGLRTRLTVEGRDGHLVDLRAQVEAERTDGSRADVLDWRLIGVLG